VANFAKAKAKLKAQMAAQQAAGGEGVSLAERERNQLAAAKAERAAIRAAEAAAKPKKGGQ
jgi:hypothetical protein